MRGRAPEIIIYWRVGGRIDLELKGGVLVAHPVIIYNMISALAVSVFILGRWGVLLVLGVASGFSSNYDEQYGIEAAQLAGVAYCDVPMSMALSCPACGVINSTYTSLNMTEVAAEWGVHAFVIMKSEQKRRVVVAFRGTDSPLELVSEIAHDMATLYPFCEVEKGNGVKLQNYFVTVYEALRPAFREALTRILSETPEDYEFLFTGHSLGASLTAIAAADAMHTGMLRVTPKVYTFGEPRTGNYEFAMWFSEMFPEYFRVTHYRDLVVHVSPCMPSFQGGCSTDIGLLGWAPYHGGTEVHYSEYNQSHEVLQEFESPKGSNQYTMVDVTDHLYYYGFRVGCGDWQWDPVI